MRATASRVRSPPESTSTRLCTSSPSKRKPPRMFRMAGTMWIGEPEDSVPWTVRAGSSRLASSWAKYCATTCGPATRAPLSGASAPASIRMSVDLPAPLGPTSANPVAALDVHVHPSKTRNAPYALHTLRSSSTVRPLLALAGKLKWTRLRSGGTSIGVTFSSILIRLCTWAAFVAL